MSNRDFYRLQKNTIRFNNNNNIQQKLTYLGFKAIYISEMKEYVICLKICVISWIRKGSVISSFHDYL